MRSEEDGKKSAKQEEKRRVYAPEPLVPEHSTRVVQNA